MRNLLNRLSGVLRSDRGENSIMQVVTIVVSAVLIAAGTVSAPGLIQQSRIATAQANLVTIAAAQESYNAKRGAYATNVGQLVKQGFMGNQINVSGCGDDIYTCGSVKMFAGGDLVNGGCFVAFAQASTKDMFYVQSGSISGSSQRVVRIPMDPWPTSPTATTMDGQPLPQFSTTYPTDCRAWPSDPAEVQRTVTTVNYTHDPSVEGTRYGTSRYWSAPVASDSSWADSGSKSLKVSSNQTGDSTLLTRPQGVILQEKGFDQIAPGDTITVSATITAPLRDINMSFSGRVSIPGGTRENLGTTGNFILKKGEVKRVYATYVIPAGATTYGLQALMIAGNPLDSYFLIDSFQITKGSERLPFGYGETKGWQWAGDVNNSQSFWTRPE